MSRVDPVLLQILRGGFLALIREMTIVIDRTSMSPMIREKNDYSVGIYTPAGELVTGEFLLQGPELIQPVLERYPADQMQPGDLYLFNDPYLSHGAVGHSPDLCFVLPVFRDGRLGAFLAVFGHYWDIGGAVPGSMPPGATDLFQEGFLVPPIRLIQAGTWNQEVYQVLIRNTRFPTFFEADTKAMISAARLGERRLRELMDRYGLDTVQAAFEQMLATTRRRARALMNELVPEGSYSFSTAVDQDPVTGKPLRVAVVLKRKGDRISIDLTGCDDQAKGPVNCLLPPAMVKLMLGRYLEALDPLIVLNDGLVTVADEVMLRPGSIAWPTFPAPTGTRGSTKMKVLAAMLGALGEATHGRVPAASATYAIYRLMTQDPVTGESRYFAEGFGVGQGARPHTDGIDSVYFIRQKNYASEWLEMEFPYRVERYSIRPDSGGPGEFRGGVGVIREIRVLADEAVLGTDMGCDSSVPTHGISGGKPGATGYFVLNPGTPAERQVAPLGSGVPLKKGDLVQIVSAGGGGWGDPLKRRPEAVLADVARGYVATAAAAQEYGVVLQPGSRSVDLDRTRDLRLRMAASR